MIRRSAGLLRSLVVYWRPGRQPGLRRLYGPFVGPGDVVFDVGAHLGDRAAAFASLGARVVALEPQPHLVRWLRRLVGRRPGMTILQEAAGAEPGFAEMAVSESNPTVSTLADQWRTSIAQRNPTFRRVRWEGSVEVPVTTLDRLVETYGLPRFCKIDVEGHEAAVLAGLSHPVEALSVEFLAGTLEVTRDCIARLRELGEYRYNAVPGEARQFLFDAWVDADGAEAWLAEGAGGISSGDLYAWRADVAGGAR